MEWFVIYLSIFVSIPLLGASIEFRCDYTYSSEVKGWLKLHQQAARVEYAVRKCATEGTQLAIPSDEAMQRAMLLMMNRNVSMVHTGFPIFYNKTSLNENQIWVLQNNAKLKKVGRSESHPYFCFHPDTSSIKGCGARDDGYELNGQTGQCYKFHRNRETWEDARDACVGEGGYLAVVNSDAEAEELQRLFFRNPPNTIPNTRCNRAYIGFRKVYQQTWRTIFGDSLQYTGYNRWAPYEPNNGNGDEYCGSFDRNGMLYDNSCTQWLPFICERDSDTPLVCL